MNDMVLQPQDLARGIVATCDGAIDPSSMRPSIMTVTIEVPYPMVPLDRAMRYSPFARGAA